MTGLNKGGMPPLVKGQTRVITSVSLTHAQQIKFKQLGSSKWLQKAIEKAWEEAKGNSLETFLE